jgi:DNA-binding NarL/FixJ family response regulator
VAWADGQAMPREQAVSEALAPEVRTPADAVAPGTVPDAATAPATAPATRGPAGRRALPGGLTPREAEVLALVAAGRSNLEIAAALVLSVRTGERHLARVYGKLGAGAAAPRAAAAAYAVAHGLAASPHPAGVE